MLDVDWDGDLDLDVIDSEETGSAGDGRAILGVVWYENARRGPGTRALIRP